MLANSGNRLVAANDTIFDSWTPLSAYLYGVLYSDGHVTRPPHHGVKIYLGEKDMEWLLFLRSCFCPFARVHCVPIRDQWRPRNAIGFNFSSRQVVSQLRSFGIKERPPEMPDDMIRHFVRGIFDGDGCAYYDSQSGAVRLSIVGDPLLMHWVVEQARRLAGVTKKAGPYKVSNSSKVLMLRWTGSSVPVVRDWLYSGVRVCLERKRALAFKEL